MKSFSIVGTILILLLSLVGCEQYNQEVNMDGANTIGDYEEANHEPGDESTLLASEAIDELVFSSLDELLSSYSEECSR